VGAAVGEVGAAVGSAVGATVGEVVGATVGTVVGKTANAKQPFSRTHFTHRSG
jgi:phage tail tape-measure protein